MSQVSAAGERAAMSGYKHQYDLFAQRIYDEMINNNLVRISVASDEVGKLDDIFYETRKAIFAYQIKWSIDKDAIMSITDFKELVVDIAKSWKRIQQSKEKPVMPFLLTSRHVSDKYDIDAEIKGIKNKTELTDEEFSEFAKVFQFVERSGCEEFLVTNADTNIRTSDVLKLHRLIEETAGGNERRVEFTCAELIEKLNWQYRFNRRFNHDLFVDEDHYVPIHKTVEKLNAAIETHHSGYIFLQGMPGSGKSSLLSHFARYSRYNIVTYYAFDFVNPSSPDNIFLRGEAVSLFHDLVLALNERGYNYSGHIVSNDLKELRDMFFAQLSQMHNNYVKDGNRTIIVIDGLDHIIREYKDCEHEFIALLPSPKSIPEGITIILGSQHFNESLTLLEDIHAEYKDESRVVMMDALTGEEMVALIDKTLPAEIISKENTDEIISKSQGHPLYLTYIIEALRRSDDLASTLKNLPEYNKDVETYYRSIISKILAESCELTHLLGLLSRINDEVHWEFIKEWSPSENVVRTFVTSIKPLLRYNENSHSLSFFHNSFRQFLLGETGRDAMTGDMDKQKAQGYYSELADLYLKSGVEKHWLAFQYLYLANRYEDFLNMATPSELSQEVSQFRPLSEIEKDAVYGLYIGRNLNDPYIVLRYMLAKSEVEQRKNQDYSALTFTDDFIDLGEYELAKNLLHRGNSLLCNETGALISSRKFYAAGDIEEARLLLDLAYPRFLYVRNDKLGYTDNFNHRLEVLKEWMRTASYFYGDEQLNGYLASFTKNLFDSQERSYERYSFESIYAALEESVMIGLFDKGDTDRFKSRLQTLILNIEKNPYTPFSILRYVLNGCLAMDDTENAKKYFEILRKIYDDTDPHQRIIIAYDSWLLYHDVDEVKAIIEGLEFGQLSTPVKLEMETPLVNFRPMYRLAFLRRLCGFDDSVVEAVPKADIKDGGHETITTFARNLCILAKTAADGELGKGLSYDFNQIMKSLLLFFRSIDNRDVHLYALNKYRIDYYKIAISVAARFGNEGIAHIRKVIREVFTETNAYSDLKREAALKLFRYDGDSELLRKCLLEVETTMLEGQDQNGRMEQFTKQGRAWLRYGDKDKGIDCFRRVLNDTFCVGYSKDYQVSWFTEYTREINRIEPERSIERLKWITLRLKYVDTITDQSSLSDIVDELLKAAFSYNIASGLNMYLWMLDREFTTFVNGFAYMIEGILTEVETKEEYGMLVELFCRLFLFVDDYEDGHPYLLKKILKKGIALYDGKLPDEIKRKIDHAVKTECTENVQESYSKIELGEAPLDNERIPKGSGDDDAFTWINKGEDAYRDGNMTEAWKCAEKAIRLSRSSGWIKFYDGGSRIFTFRLMGMIDKDKAQELALKTLVDDLAHGYSYGMTQHIDDILSLVTDEVDKSKVYAEWQSYMNRLLCEESAVKGDYPAINTEPSGVSDIIIRFILILGRSLVNPVRERASYLLALLLNHGCDKIVDYLRVENNNKLTLDVGKFLLEENSPKLTMLGYIVKPLALSRNILWRMYAVDILNALHLDTPDVPRINRPAIYNLQYEENDYRLLDNKGKNIKQKENDHKIGSPFVDFLCEIFHVSEDIIYYRANQLALHYTSEHDMTDEADSRLRTHLDKIYLKMSFLHTYSEGVLNGIMEAAGELLDSSSMTLEALRPVFTLYDYAVSTWSVEEKPTFIHHIEIDEYHILPKNWENEASKCSRLNTTLADYSSKVVIGESTLLTSTNDGLPSEEYLQMIVPEGFANEGRNFFGDMPYHRLSKDYYHLRCHECQPPVVIRESFFVQFSHKTSWIAFNPQLAKELNWEPMEDCLFGWKNKDGELMVESIYWNHGNTQNMGLRWTESGEGWIVVATPKAVESIKQFYGVNLVQSKRVVRTYKGATQLYKCLERLG